MSNIHLDLYEDEASLTAGQPSGTTVIEESATVVLEFESVGLPGATGVAGPTGPPGPPGAGTSTRVVFDVPLAQWDYAHNFGAYPAVTVLDSVGRIIEADVQYIDANNVRINFSTTVAGVLLLN